LILVTGAGRSGTSTVAGTLHHLGFHVPEPVMKGNKSNPRGFFESWWPVRFHQRIMTNAVIEQTDGRPAAGELMREAVDDDVRAELVSWLSGVAEVSDRVVVKDPRAFWVSWLWVDAAGEVGLDISFLTMLRHPTEVLGSRQTYYAGYRPHMDRWAFAVWNLCSWINANLLTEQLTRSQRRTFVLYVDLLEDWRTAMKQVAADLTVTFDDDLDPGHAHEVDDFIDAGLRRHEVDWGDWDMPAELVDIAETTWAALVRLGELGGHDDTVESELDAVRERYATLYGVSAAISQDTATARVAQARIQIEKELRAEFEAEYAETVPAVQATPTALPEAEPDARPQQASPVARVKAVVTRVLDRYPALRRARERLRRS
jgi:hypothetical protein